MSIEVADVSEKVMEVDELTLSSLFTDYLDINYCV